MSRRRPAALAAILALAVPAPALAQSAGDDQYRDPFAGGEGGQSDQSGPDQSQSQPQAAPAPAPPSSAPATTQEPDPAPAAPGSEPVATTAGQLPRTGSDAIWVAGIGVLLVAAGLRLRRKRPA